MLGSPTFIYGNADGGHGVAVDTGNKVLVKDFRHIILTIACSGLSSGKKFTIACQGSSEDTPPDFSVARSLTNLWDYVQMIKQTDGTSVDGSTGDEFSATDDVRIYQVNVDGLTWLDLSTISATLPSGVTVLAKCVGYSDR